MAIRGLLILGAFLALAVVKTWPVLTHFTAHIGGQGTDALLNTWILSWDVHALTTHPLRLFDANLSYPMERSLAFSDHMLGVVPFFASAYVLTGSPAAGYNTLLVASFALSAFAAFSLAWYWTRRWWPSIVVGTLFGFSPVRFAELGHLQLLNFFWAPWALIFLDRFLRGRRWPDLGVFAIFYWLQVLSSVYLAYMLTVSVGLYVGYYAVGVDRTLLGRALIIRAAVFLVASLAALSPFTLAYVTVQRAWEASWTAGAMAGYSADLQSYLSTSTLVNDLYVALFSPVTRRGAMVLFPGLVMPFLAVLGLFASIRGIARAEVRRARRVFGLIAIVSFVLSLGPYLVIFGVNTRIPMPYLLLYYVVPGWSAMRAPGRFAFAVLLALVPLAALGAQFLIERVRRAPSVAGLALVGLSFLELGAKPLPLQAVPTGHGIPEVYRWLARARPGPIVEIPVDIYRADQTYLYLSTAHWLPIVNGRSGFAPASHDEVKAVLAELPGTRARQYAAALGLGAIVVHGDRLRRVDQVRWTAAEDAGHLRRLATFGADVVYAVPPATLARTLRAHVAAPEVLPSGVDVRLGLRLENADVLPWAQGRPHGVDRAVVRWRETGTGRTNTATVAVTPPLVVGGGESFAIPLRVTVPSTPGRYALDITLPGHALTAEGRIIEVRRSQPPPTSAEARDLLMAGYTLKDEAGPRAVAPADSLRVKLIALNEGRAVWLTKARSKKGNVVLEWRWAAAGGREISQAGGQAHVRYDVYPGDSYEFDEWVQPPVEPGRYALELGLTSVGIGRFTANGSRPLTVVVDVARYFPVQHTDD